LRPSIPRAKNNRVKSTSLLPLLGALLCPLVLRAAPDKALDPLITGTGLWQTPRATFVDEHRSFGFYWLSSAHDRAESHSKNLSLFGAPVYEVDASFQGDNLSGLTISIYNRGDAGELDFPHWKTLVTNSVNALNTLTKTQGVAQGPEAADAVKAFGMSWQTPAISYLLEYSSTREVKSRGIPFRAEFLRLQVTPPQKQQSFMAAALASAAPRAAFDGPSHLKKDSTGDVRIDGIPMVDQGHKGYCVDASAERVMRYYGIAVDEHEIAELANSSATQGTSPEAMVDSLKRLAQRLRIRTRTLLDTDVHQVLDVVRNYDQLARREHAAPIPDQGLLVDPIQIYASMKPDLLKEARNHNKADTDRFEQLVQQNIDQGIPLLWTIVYGVVQEKNGPAGVGGHMRLIIGYNTATGEILYTDSWGPGHELKRMPTADAWTMTLGLNAIEPIADANN
jgi:hypothetical protein